MVKKSISIFAVMLSSMTAFAQLTDGFYRVQNNGCGKFLYVRDCVGEAATSGTDLGAIELWADHSKTLSDPSSVVYVEKHGGQYDIQGQGTGIYALLKQYVTISGKPDNYMLYASGQYLYYTGDNDLYEGMGMIGPATTGKYDTDQRLWKALPVSSKTDNYFGFTPTLTTTEGKLYTTFYADFAYTPVSSDVKTWYVSKVDESKEVAVISPLTGTVARSQAVIIECAGKNPSDNKIDITRDEGHKTSNNHLVGTYFDCGRRSNKSHANTYPAIIPFDNKTMRVLVVGSNGKLSFTNSDASLDTYRYHNGKKWVNGKCIAHNTAYLKVNTTCPANLTVMTEEEYDAFFRDKVGEAKIATDVTVSETKLEKEGDIAAKGGENRAMATVTYNVSQRTFYKDGGYSDKILSEGLTKTIYGNTVSKSSLGTTETARTKAGTSTPTGTLEDSEGNALKTGTVYSNLTNYQATAKAADIYQEVNVATAGEVTLTLKQSAYTLKAEGETVDLSSQVTTDQKVSYTSGATRDGNVKVVYTANTADGFTLNNATVTASANNQFKVRDGFIVTVRATGEGSKTTEKQINFAQAAKGVVAENVLYMATEVKAGSSSTESGKDIPAKGGKDRAKATVTYKVVKRTFMNNGTYTDQTVTENRTQVIYGAYVETASMATTESIRTKVGSSQPKGILTDADGKELYAATEKYASRVKMEATAGILDLYQEANKATYGDVNLSLSQKAVDVSSKGDTTELAMLVKAEQVVTFTSGATRTGKVNISFTETAAVEGFTLKDGVITATENNAESQRTYTVTVTAQGEGGMSKTANITFTQQTVQTGIEGIATTQQEGAIYNLQGQRIQQNRYGQTNGVYIKNGRKIINRR